MVLRFQGHAGFRQRLILATLSQKAVTIHGIRPEDDTPGLRDYEVAFLRLLERVTNGSVIEISYTGTSVHYRPGIISGGPVHHVCPPSRSVGYFLEPIVALAPFSKAPFEITLEGVTNDNVDPTVDMIRTVLLPNLRKFGGGLEDGLELQITKRGASPLGGGLVLFRSPTVRQLKPLQFTDPGRVKRIRGVAYCTRVSPQMENRAADTARGRLTDFIPDVYVYTDVYKGEESGKSPGYGITLVAETTTGALYHAEVCFQPSSPSPSSSTPDAPQRGPSSSSSSSLRRLEAAHSTTANTDPDLVSRLGSSFTFSAPEEMSESCVRRLAAEIDRGGCVDTECQWLVLLMMVLGSEDVGKVRLGREVSDFTIQYLRDIRTFFGAEFRAREDEETDTVMMSCVGVGYSNFAKKVT